MKPDNNAGLDYLCLSKGNFEILLRELLLVKLFRAELFKKKVIIVETREHKKEQTQCPIFQNNDSRSNDWHLEAKGSPGNLIQFESILFNNNEMDVGTTLIALNFKLQDQQKKVGVASVDANERLISIIEFIDDDFFSELEAIIVLLGPKECVLPTADGEFKTIKKLLDRNNVMVTMTKKTDFNLEKSDLVQDLNKLLKFEKGQQENAHTLPEMSKTVAMSALGAALKYLNLIGDSCNLGHFEMKLLDLKRFVHLDAAAVSALNLHPKPGTVINSSAYRWHSILGVLDRCKTAQGHRLMAQWVKQPLRNEAIIKDRHDIVQCFIDASTARTDLHESYMKRMPDVMVLCKRLMRKKASLKDLYRLYQVVARIPKILAILSDLLNPAVDSVIVSPMKETFGDVKLFKQMVEQVIDAEGIKRGEYFIRPSFDTELETVKASMDEVEEKMDKKLKAAAKDLNLDAGTTIKLEYVAHHGHHFRITLSNESVLRKNNKYKTLDAVKGGVRFNTDALVLLNDELNEIRKAYEEQQQSIVEEVIRVALGYLAPLSCLNGQLAQLDCLLSFAIAAISAPICYTRPTMSPEGNGVLEFKQLRHPCLELQEDVTFIPNDCSFKKEETHMSIITGPNMGGKSTYIRSVGAAVLMAQVGSFVPCEYANISIVDCILGRVGADDNINKGLSTFMVEMIETAQIIRTATENSLVVIDELGRGTSTYEGCGIAWSIAEHLAKVTKCFTLFATHFHEITELAAYVPTVKNSHMVAVADSENFTLLYQVKPGVMDKSFGIHVAKLANFPQRVVEEAQKMYDETDDHKSDDEKKSTKYLQAMDILDKIDASSVDDIVAIVQKTLVH
ncbi:hypothetical protein HA402_014504 [Bradysia odoriphaga]|nr:hypothetical protein HA402_014504 [Bradysia odoriphaga]